MTFTSKYCFKLNFTTKSFPYTLEWITNSVLFTLFLQLYVDLQTILPGPPYLFGVFTVIVAIMIAFFIPKSLDHVYRPLTTKNPDSSSESMMKLSTARNLNQKKISGKLSDTDDPPLIHTDEDVL